MTGCGAGYEYVAVTPEGEIFPCHQLVGRREYSMGDIRNGIHRKDLMRRFCESRVPENRIASLVGPVISVGAAATLGP